jgi:uncharacterized protein (DUF2062 family)/SAM-dependent methyltransferase
VNVALARAPRPPRVGRGLRWAFRYLRGGAGGGALVASVAVGLFVGCLPLYGLHLPLVLLVCLPLRLDAVLAYVAANISNPLVAPVLLFLEVQVGSLVLEQRWLSLDVAGLERVGLGGLLLQTVVGSLIVASAVAALGALCAWPFARSRAARQIDPFDHALSRVFARYAKVHPADRIYVPMKLLSDPVVEQLFALSEGLGSVSDVGCGRGQFGLFLLELGASALCGFDWDERKLRAARSAAGHDAEFRQGDLRTAELPPADTTLLIDVLHYLTPAEQDALLARAASRLRERGRLLIRDTEPHAGWRSRLTRAIERVATRVGYNRAGELHYRPSAEIVAALRALGLDTSASISGGLWLSNVLIVAQKPGQVLARAASGDGASGGASLAGSDGAGTPTSFLMADLSEIERRVAELVQELSAEIPAGERAQHWTERSRRGMLALLQRLLSDITEGRPLDKPEYITIARGLDSHGISRGAWYDEAVQVSYLIAKLVSDTPPRD